LHKHGIPSPNKGKFMATKPVSIEKLQAFIEAVEFAADLENPDEWVPTARQWRKIRSMIDALEDQPAQQISQPVHYQPMSYGLTAGGQPGPVGPIQLAGPSAFDNLPPAPMMGGGAPVPLARAEGMQVRTPDVDTSNGHYDSSFA
jgi:hypothetical protein